MSNEVEEFLADLEEYSSDEVDMEYISLTEEYFALFGKTVPLEMLSSKLSYEELKSMIKNSIQSGCNREIEEMISKTTDYILY